MNGGKNRKPRNRGYTLVEVMVFLAISGFTFVLAAAFISGKQDSVQYRQGMNDASFKVRGVVNDVANGEYPPLGTNYYCNGSGFGIPTIQTGGTNGQGENIGCIFMGKVFQPGVDNEPTSYALYTVAGRQLDATGNVVTDFAGALPFAIHKALPANLTLTFKGAFAGGLEFSKAKLCSPTNCQSPGTGTDISAVGFFGSFGGYSSTLPGSLESGSQSIITTVFPTNVVPNSSDTMALNINANLKTYIPTSSNVVTNGSYVLFCFKHGTKKGSLTIGGANGQQLTTDVQMGQGVAYPCLT